MVLQSATQRCTDCAQPDSQYLARSRLVALSTASIVSRPLSGPVRTSSLEVHCQTSAGFQGVLRRLAWNVYFRPQLPSSLFSSKGSSPEDAIHQTSGDPIERNQDPDYFRLGCGEISQQLVHRPANAAIESLVAVSLDTWQFLQASPNPKPPVQSIDFLRFPAVSCTRPVSHPHSVPRSQLRCMQVSSINELICCAESAHAVCATLANNANLIAKFLFFNLFLKNRLRTCSSRHSRPSVRCKPNEE